MFGDLDPVNNYDNDSSVSYYNLLLLFTRFMLVASYIVIKFGESRNRLDFKSQPARVSAGLITSYAETMHTTRGQIEFNDPKGKFFCLGPHHTGFVDAASFATTVRRTPPRFFVTDNYSFLPGLESFFKMARTIIVPTNPPKSSNGKTANAGVIELGHKALMDDDCVAMFPQGNLVRDGEPAHRVYPGAAKLALKAKVPVNVIRLDGYSSVKNRWIPAFIRKNSYFLAFGTAFLPNNVRVTKCCEIDFHLKDENANLSEEELIREISAQLWAYYRRTEDLTPQQISGIKSDIASGLHLLMWDNKVEQDRLGKMLPQFKDKEARAYFEGQLKELREEETSLEAASSLRI